MSAAAKLNYVLVVDDDPTIITFINAALEMEGLDCQGAANGESARAKIEARNPSLILLDVAMPRMNGKELCEWLRANGRGDIPVIIMTAGSNAEKTCEEVGAIACLAKPFELAELQSCVRRWARNA
jgi:DNA-binding response OmpR family regulator